MTDLINYQQSVIKGAIGSGAEEKANKFLLESQSSKSSSIPPVAAEYDGKPILELAARLVRNVDGHTLMNLPSESDIERERSQPRNLLRDTSNPPPALQINGEEGVLLEKHLPEFALAYAELKFNQIHEPGNGSDQITRSDLNDYEQSHPNLGPMERLFTRYLESHFDAIRNADPIDEGPIRYAHNASGITWSDLQTGRRTIGETLQKLAHLEDDDNKSPHPAYSKENVQLLQSQFSNIARSTDVPNQTGQATPPSIDSFDVKRYADCLCHNLEPRLAGLLRNVAPKISEIAKAGGAVNGQLTPEVLDRAIGYLQTSEIQRRQQLEAAADPLAQKIEPYYNYARF